jgi:hypothetical protein
MTPDPRSAVERLAKMLYEQKTRPWDDASEHDRAMFTGSAASILRAIGAVFPPAELVEAVREAEAYREQPPERPLNEWRERHEARVVAAKVALADAVIAQLAAGRGGTP